MVKKGRTRLNAKAPKGAKRVIVRQRLGRKPPPPNETPRDRFCRIGERRVNEVVNKIGLIGNLSGGNYACTQADLDAIKSTIQIALDSAMSRFGRTVRQHSAGFTFGSDRSQASPPMVPRLNENA